MTNPAFLVSEYSLTKDECQSFCTGFSNDVVGVGNGEHFRIEDEDMTMMAVITLKILLKTLWWLI